MKYASRIEKIPPYLFAEIDRAIARKKAQGVDVINLGIGDPDIPTPDNIVEKLCEASKDPANHGYPTYEGMPSFREAVARWYKKRFGVSLDPETEVLTLIGSKEGIGNIPLAFVNPNDVVLFSDPGYPVYRIGTILADGKPVPMPLLKENRFLPDFDGIDSKTAKNARMMHVNYPNNPTAATADVGFFDDVIEFANDNDIIVCHDAPYSEVSFDGYKAPSFLQANGAKDVGIEFHSLSKTYNMTGWRIGFAVGNSEIISGLGRVKQNIDSGAFQAIQVAGIEALEGPQKEVEKNMKTFERRRNVMYDGLKKLDWSLEKPKATFYLWCEIPDEYKSSLKFSKDLLERTGVVMTPGIGFGEHGEGFVRIALTQTEERLKEALGRIGKSV